ncbi:MAG: PEP-utilizing enzyme [Actinomycetota bacterium]|nr:PEP-utilizing enzyme [Actinomycetota bacterium]
MTARKKTEEQRFVYGFFDIPGEAGDALGRLGKRGATLGRMGRLGVPIPEGFVVSVEAPVDDDILRGLAEQVGEALERLEGETGRTLGDPENPLLLTAHAESLGVAGRSIFDLGLNEPLVESIARRSGDGRETHRKYLRFLEAFGRAVYGVDGTGFPETSDGPSQEEDEDLEDEIRAVRETLREAGGGEVPDDAAGQLVAVVRAAGDGASRVTVMRSIPSSREGSARGVARTHDPRTGEKGLTGEFVAGVGAGDPHPLQEMKRLLPAAYEELVGAINTLADGYRDALEVEFAVEDGRLYLLGGRVGDVVGDAAARVKISVDLVREGIISREEALLRVDPVGLPRMLHPRVDPEAGEGADVFAWGIGASPGAAAGEVVLNAKEAREKGESGESPVLVAGSLGPDDKEGMLAAAAVVTAEALASHDLLVLKGMGVPVVHRCEGMEVDAESGEVRFEGNTVRGGDSVTVDGSAGAVLLGEVPVLGTAAGRDLEELLGWADGVRRLRVRANADTPEDARRARELGAEGIGLCRTERTFMKGGLLGAVRRVILGGSGGEDAEGALSELEEGQREDLEGILRAMDGLPVSVRFLDPPLHEFLPDADDLREGLNGAEGEEADELRQTLEAVESLEETNPMLGTRGVRLGLLRPEIYRMQARAIAGAARNLRDEGGEPVVEVLVPLVQFPEELRRMKEILNEEFGDEEIPIGATIEAPRACVAAAALAREAPFLSFGTNDLTQTTLGVSRDDARESFLPEYLDAGIIEADPFDRIDRDGVGKMIELARDLGRGENPQLKLGVCGEQGGDPESIRFLHEADLDYVSCSPYRVPVARLAAAQAAIEADRPSAP